MLLVMVFWKSSKVMHLNLYIHMYRIQTHTFYPAWKECKIIHNYTTIRMTLIPHVLVLFCQKDRWRMETAHLEMLITLIPRPVVLMINIERCFGKMDIVYFRHHVLPYMHRLSMTLKTLAESTYDTILDRANT